MNGGRKEYAAKNMTFLLLRSTWPPYLPSFRRSALSLSGSLPLSLSKTAEKKQRRCRSTALRGARAWLAATWSGSCSRRATPSELLLETQVLLLLQTTSPSLSLLSTVILSLLQKTRLRWASSSAFPAQPRGSSSSKQISPSPAASPPPSPGRTASSTPPAPSSFPTRTTSRHKSLYKKTSTPIYLLPFSLTAAI